MKIFLLIIIFYGAAYNQCNESNWQEYYNSEGHDMTGCNLVGADLQNANLAGANLYLGNLYNIDLSEANLEGAFLGGANLYGAELVSTNLNGAFLSATYLYQANLTNANLSNITCWGGTFFVDATLDNTIFKGADLTYAIFDQNADLYDDNSYEAGSISGDLNLDGTSNVLDVVDLVNQILSP